MAILSNLVVHGASRFLNTAYFNDVSISGTASLASLSLSGTLAVTGAATLSSTLAVTGASTFTGILTANNQIVGKNGIELYGSTPYIDFHYNNSTADYTSRIQETASGTLTVPKNLTVSTLLTAATGAITTLNSTTSTIHTLDVTDTFWAHDFEFEIQHVVDGIMRIAPTLRFPARFNGETSTTTAMSCSKSGSTLTISITDSSISTSSMAGIVWSSGSRVKVSGKIKGVATETMSGTISSISNGSLTVQVSGGNVANITATSTLSDFDDITIMVYERKDGNNYFPAGILINCYDAANKSPTIKVYGGTSATPNVTVGNLVGLSFNGTALPTTSPLWGIHTSMGYFEGAIVSTEGQIGGWTIGENKLFNGTDSLTSTTPGTYIGAGATAATSGIRNYKDANTFVNITGGVITAKAVDLTGKITATSGSIAGWRIEPTYLASGSATAPGANVLLLSPAGTVSSYTVAGKASSGWTITSGANFGVTKTGAIYANDAHLTGEITATSGYIGGTSGWTIASQQLSNGTLAADNSMYLATKNLGSNTTIAGRSGSDWRFTVGSNFGITNTGATYASTLVIGPSDGYHATVADSAFKVYNNTTLLSSFGATTQIGASTGNNIQINSNGITMSNPSSSPRIPEIFYIGVESRTANAGTQDDPSATETTTAPYYILGQSGYDSTTPQPGAYSFQSGVVSYATGKYSTAMGHNCVASGTCAFAVGSTSQATNYASVAIGGSVLSSGICSYAEGNNTTASGYVSHAEGDQTVASGDQSHAEGYKTTASGDMSHAEGWSTIASGYRSHAEGRYTVASGEESHAEGCYTMATEPYQMAIGKYNKTIITATINGNPIYGSGNYAFIIGNGTSDTARSNALTVDWSGNLVTSGSVSANGRILLHSALTSNGTTATTTRGYTYGVAGVTSGNRIYSKWYAYLDTGVTSLSDGMTIQIKVPVAGSGSGCGITIDGGTSFHPVVYATSSVVTTHYGNGNILTLVYDSSGTGSVFGTVAGATATAAANITGVWRVLNMYDSNSDLHLRVWSSATNLNVPLIGSSSANSTTATWSTYTGTYRDWYGAIPNDDSLRPKMNLSTGVLTVPGGIVGNVTGNVTGDVTGNATTATTATTASNLSGFKNTTTSATAVDSATTNGIYYVNGTSDVYNQSDGAAFVQAYSASWVAQIYQDYRTGQIALRGKNNGTWQSWRKVLDSSNYTDYTVTKTGTGASGSWGISITGSSASCTGNAATATTAASCSGNAATATTAGNVTGTVTVGHGGTGATSFTANSVIMSGSSTTAALTTRSITNNTSASAITASTNIITANTLAYWNGAYSGTTSRLAYCNQGAFGTMATKSAANYAELSGATFTGGISGTTGTFSDVVTAANIGNIQSASKSVAITSSNTIGATPAIGAQLTLTPGTYLLWGRFVFSTSGSGTTRNNRIAFYTGASPTDSTMLTESQVCVFTANRNWGALTTTYIVSPTANTTYTVGGTSSLPGPDGGMSVIKAIRLL